MYPDRKTAEALLTEAEPHNPGPWGDHSRTAAHCAEAIAAACGLDADKAYVLGLLHDIGRRYGKRHLPNQGPHPILKPRLMDSINRLCPRLRHWRFLRKDYILIC